MSRARHPWPARCVRCTRKPATAWPARFAGLLTWEGHAEPPGGLYIFSAPAPDGDPRPQGEDEGVLAWKPRGWILSAPEVVENIHLFGPLVLGDAPLQEFHFVYGAGDIILSYEFRPLPPLEWQ